MTRPTSNTDNSLQTITHKLDMLINLLAHQAVGNMTNTEAVPLLQRLGFTPAETAWILGISSHTVSVRLNEAKKKQEKQGA